MKIGVTGAGGYIGSGLCGKLMDKGHEVVMVDNFLNARVRSVHGEEILWADIRDRNEMEEILKGCDVVVHLAAISGVADCDKMPDKAYEINVVGTSNIAWVCRKHRIDLIFPSSMAVVGNPVELPIKSTHPRNPLNLYGLTKWSGEEIIRTMSKGKFNVLIFMKTNIYGEYELDDKKITKRTVINIFVNKALKGETLTVHKPGTQTRDFIHVLDVINAYVIAVEKMPEGFNITTLAGGECLSVLDIAKLVQKFSKVDVALIENPRSEETYAENFEVDVEEARKLIGFKAKRRVEDEIRMYFRS